MINEKSYQITAVSAVPEKYYNQDSNTEYSDFYDGSGLVDVEAALTGRNDSLVSINNGSWIHMELEDSILPAEAYPEIRVVTSGSDGATAQFCLYDIYGTEYDLGVFKENSNEEIYIDLDDYQISTPVKQIKVVGTDTKGSIPGFELVRIVGIASTDTEIHLHDLSEWVITKAATIYESGERVRKCSSCDYVVTEVIGKLEEVPDASAYGNAHFTVVDAVSLKPVKNASIFIKDALGGECTLTTDENGCAYQILPVGRQNISVYAKGYSARSVNIRIEPGEQDIPVIGLSNRDLLETNVTAKVMTYDEIVDAGIDVSHISNQHVTRYEVEIHFDAFINLKFDTYFNGDGELVKISGSDVPDGDGKLPYVIFKHDEMEGKVYPVSEDFYLIIYGEARWLKEMFDVEMLIINHSLTDTIVNAEASLELPEGLSLAAMLDASNDRVQTIAEIGAGESASVHWFVRGDIEGEYQITANLKGTYMPFEEPFDKTYTTTEPIQVYAGSALNMNIYIPRYTFKGDNYPVRIELENVSDRTLYNVSNRIIGIYEGQVTYYSDGSCEEEYLLSSGAEPPVFEHDFKPGDKLVIQTTVTILFESKLIDYYKDQINNTITRVELFMDQLNLFTNTAEMMTGTLTNGGELLGDLLSASAGTIPVNKLQLISDLKDAVTKFTSTFGIDDKIKMDVLNAMDSLGILDTFTRIASDPSAIENEDPTTIQQITNLLNMAINNSESVSIYDSLRTFVSALPVGFRANKVLVSTMEGSTTEIPWHVHIENNPVEQYFGIDDLKTYFLSLGIMAFDEFNSNTFLDIFFDSATNSAEKYISMQNNQMMQVIITDTTESVEVKAWVEESTVTRSVNVTRTPFLLTCNNENAVYEDDVLTFTGSGTITVTANGSSGGKIYVSKNGEIVRTYIVEGVETHTCTAEEWVLEIHPTENYTGIRSQYCDTCGELIAADVVELCEEHSYGTSYLRAHEETTNLYCSECTMCGHQIYTLEKVSVIDSSGDINQDGVINKTDSAILAQYFAGYHMVFDLTTADVDKNGKITRRDAMILARYVAGWDGYDKYFQ